MLALTRFGFALPLALIAMNARPAVGQTTPSPGDRWQLTLDDQLAGVRAVGQHGRARG